jgi:3-oxoacyl-[acyl-carrier-protein] synthase-3
VNNTYSRIVGTGSYLPEKVLTNRDLELAVDTTDEWIFTRTGIRQRHIAAEGETTSDLALEASRSALHAAGIAAGDLDLIVMATTTPDMVFPSTACLLQAKLGVRNCPAFDVQAVCSGFVYGLATADSFMRSGQYRNVLVVGAEIYSRILDWSDRSTCVLFGDGAGAVVLKRDSTPGIMSSHLHADGSYANQLSVPGTVCGGKVSGRCCRWTGQGYSSSQSRRLTISSRKPWRQTGCRSPISTGWSRTRPISASSRLRRRNSA